MGLVRYYVEPIIREHMHCRIRGNVLILGRQTTYFTPEQAYKIIKDCGYVPNESAYKNAKLDTETVLGGNRGEKSAGKTILDKSFFAMLDIPDVSFLDHDAYEGGDIIFDLNDPVPDMYADRFDFIIDGGCFDNIFNPSQAIINIDKMLRRNGRFITFNVVSYTWSPYMIVPYGWYLDYFALNGYVDCKIYLSVFFQNGSVSTYTPNLQFIQDNATMPVFGLSGKYLHLIYLIAEKGEGETKLRFPSQDIYRSENEWDAFIKSLRLFQESTRLDHVRSLAAPPIREYHLNEFLYIDEAGDRQLPADIALPDYSIDYSAVAIKMLAHINATNEPITLLGRAEDFNELVKDTGVSHAVENNRVILVSLYDALKEIEVKSGDKIHISPVSRSTINGSILLNCSRKHKDRLSLYEFADSFEPKGIHDLLADELDAKEYWSASVGLPSSFGLSRTYIVGLP